jgi:plastocyanin
MAHLTAPAGAAAALRRRWWAAAAAAVAAGVAIAGAVGAAAPPVELSGTLELTGRGARGTDPTAAVVYFEPAAGARAPAPRTLTIETRNKQFSPRVLAVPRGSTVRFPNRDPILHNVFSVSRGNAFDLGLLGEGPGAEAVFAQPGLVRIYCNVHHGMVAYVMVLDTPHYATPDAAGRFRLAGLPAGRGRLTAWHEQTEPATLDLALPAPGPVAVELDVARPRVPRHLNKLGKSYGRGRDRY